MSQKKFSMLQMQVLFTKLLYNFVWSAIGILFSIKAIFVQQLWKLFNYFCAYQSVMHVCVGVGGYVVFAGLCKPQGSVLLSVMHPCLHGTVHHCHI